MAHPSPTEKAMRTEIDWRLPAKAAWQKSEHELQVAFVSHAAPLVGDDLFAIPNGDMRKITVAMRLQAEGVRKGVPDLFLPIPKGGFHGLFIELKKAGGCPSPEQWERMERMHLAGYMVRVVNSLGVAMEILTGYLNA